MYSKKTWEAAGKLLDGQDAGVKHYAAERLAEQFRARNQSSSNERFDVQQTIAAILFEALPDKG